MKSCSIMDLLRKLLIFGLILLCFQRSESKISTRSVSTLDEGDVCIPGYSGRPPNCQRICPMLNNLSNGVVEEVYQVLFNVGYFRVIYNCNNGYTLSGSYSRFCSSSGSWSGSNPSCLRICPILNNPSNGQVSVSSYFIGGRANYSCNTGYGLSGSSSRTCSSSGWSGSNPSCQRLDDDCDFKFASFANEQKQTQERVLQSIGDIVGFAPELVTDIFNPSHTESVSSSSIFTVMYTFLSQKFNVSLSDSKFNSFVQAITEVNIAEKEACSGSYSRSNADILEIVMKFNRAFSAGKSGDLTEVRALYGQMLCVKRQEHAPGTKRTKRSSHCPEDDSNCTCPEGGFDEPDNIICACHFFRCLDPDRHFKPILGFTAKELQCLAFVIDTTGSMSEEITDAKRLLNDFVHAEENLLDGCYLLVPFNDVGPDEDNVPDASVDNITYISTDKALDLKSFYKNLNDLKADGGGDEPEYSLDAMLKTLNFLDPDRLPAMTRGSQMIVITDATSKNQNLELNVIHMANRIGVCIHFFVSDDGAADGLYKRIAEGTSGTLTISLSNWNITTFTSSYRESPCKHEVSRRKRAAIITRSTSRCQSFHISELSILFRFSGNTNSSVNLTRPSGTTIEVLGGARVAIHSERNPEPGEWLACLSSGDLEFSVNQDYSLDATLGYLKNINTGTIVASISPPTECCTGQVMLYTSRIALIFQPRLSMLDSNRTVIQTAHLAKCSTAFVANMSFPRGEYTYSLDGVDKSGVSVSYRFGKKVVFRPGEYELVANGQKTIKIELSDTFNFNFSISNLNSYASTFDFSTTSPGFIATLQKKRASLSPGETLNVVVVSWVASSSVRKGSTHTIEFRASNGCVILSDTKTVMIKAGTPPPADVCGCQNGGTCVVQTRRGREFKRCLCPSGYWGRTCET